jgi:hypothetical protein
MAAGEVDDAQACVRQSRGSIDEDTVIIWTAMTQGSDHPFENVAAGRFTRPVHVPCNTAHPPLDAGRK